MQKFAALHEAGSESTCSATSKYFSSGGFKMKVFILSKLSVSSQINALLFFSKVLSGSDLVKNSSEIRERLREQHQVAFSIHRCWLGEVWSQYNLVSSGKV